MTSTTGGTVVAVPLPQLTCALAVCRYLSLPAYLS
jgi:hypothetical protein